MVERIKKLIAPMIITAVIVIGICCIIKLPESCGAFFTYVSYAVSCVATLFVIYERYLWKYIPWNIPPVLNRKYDGKIHYKYENEEESKDIIVIVKQTWLTLHIGIKTNINSSSSLTAEIVCENNENVLYYSYVTNPSALNEKKNTIQHGTCRMILNDDNSKITGKYWTSSQTIGDIVWNAEKE